MTERRSVEEWAWQCGHVVVHVGKNSLAMCPDCACAYAAQETAALQQRVEALEKENVGLRGVLEEFRAGVARDVALDALRGGETG